MKISKLFHWLYAILMLLPVFAVGVKCCYVIFNKNAKDSYKGIYQYTEVLPLTVDNYLYDENAYISVNALKEGSYGYNLKVSQIKNVSGALNYDYLVVVSYRAQNDTLIKIYDTMPSYITLTNITSFGPNFNADSQTESNNLVLDTSKHVGVYQLDLTFNYIGAAIQQVSSTNTQIDISSFTYNTTFNSLILNFDSPILYNYIFDSSLSSVFYSALQELDKTTFFGWAKNSFVAQPMLYIGNLFGIVDTHPIFTFMAYWTAISITWLVFDLVMYVPLLTHRWLDKGVIE